MLQGVDINSIAYITFWLFHSECVLIVILKIILH